MLCSFIIGIIVAYVTDEAKILLLALRIRMARIGINTGATDVILDRVEDDLREYSARMDLPYIRPELSAEGKRLLVHSPAHFSRRYIMELRRTCHSGANFVYI